MLDLDGNAEVKVTLQAERLLDISSDSGTSEQVVNKFASLGSRMLEL
jgi:hypothetical protein